MHRSYIYNLNQLNMLHVPVHTKGSTLPPLLYTTSYEITYSYILHQIWTLQLYNIWTTTPLNLYRKLELMVVPNSNQ